MDRQPAIDLTLGLAKHPPLVPNVVDEAYIFNLLINSGVPTSMHLWHPLRYNKYEIYDDDRVHTLFIRRVLQNNVADYLLRRYGEGQLKRIWTDIVTLSGRSDWHPVTKRLRESPEMLEMMAKAANEGYPYSLASRLQTESRTMPTIADRPLILILGAELDRIVAWETANISYWKREASGKVIPITREAYLSM